MLKILIIDDQNFLTIKKAIEETSIADKVEILNKESQRFVENFEQAFEVLDAYKNQFDLSA
jgi:hypothetical protein